MQCPMIVTPQDEDAARAWDEFWKTAHFNVATSHHRFLAFYASTLDGETTVRRINSEEIIEIITDPEDSSLPLFYKRQWTTSDGKQKTMFYPDWKALFQGDLDRAELPSDAIRADEDTVVCLLHA